MRPFPGLDKVVFGIPRVRQDQQHHLGRSALQPCLPRLVRRAAP